MSGRVITGPELRGAATVDCDVCVVGSGAGGALAAATLAEAGARVVVLEEGGHHTRHEFDGQEATAYPTLYQEHGNRATDDVAIVILQGRTVGGGTTVNWTSSFRPPESTLRIWAERHGVNGIDTAALRPHLEAVERRLSIHDGDPDDVNRNNAMLRLGAERLGLHPALIRRNVKGCGRLGYCGMGCPLDAKQSALVTYVPDALAAGADLYANTRADRIELDAGDRKVVAVHATVLDEARDRPSGASLVVRPRRGLVLAAGALGSPALLLRSRVPDPAGRVGRRTFLHPTVSLVGDFEQPIEGFYGPPQSVAVHDFADRGDRVGYFLETAPVHPMLAAVAFQGFGSLHRTHMTRLAHAQATIALLVDGHHGDEGGRVTISASGRPVLSYPITPPLIEAARHALETMARVQLAAGARRVVSFHREPVVVEREADVAKLSEAPFGPNLYTLFSAHQMGGCGMGDDPRRAVVSSRGRHHAVENLWVCDGSVFPTGLGVNPQLTIFALSRLFATDLARSG